jgi:hypothetical protein
MPPLPVTYLSRNASFCCVLRGQPAADASSIHPEPEFGFRVVCFLRVPHTAHAVTAVTART